MYSVMAIQEQSASVSGATRRRLVAGLAWEGERWSLVAGGWFCMVTNNGIFVVR